MQRHSGRKIYHADGGSPERLEGTGPQSGAWDRTSRALSDSQEFALYPEGVGELLEGLRQRLGEQDQISGLGENEDQKVSLLQGENGVKAVRSESGKARGGSESGL